MKVYRPYDSMLGVRIGYENLGSESLGTGTGEAAQSTSARCGTHGSCRGTTILPEGEFQRV
jgi:hypothetical protein